MQPDNEQFISGAWYNKEYGHKWYKSQYIDKPEPLWAQHYKDYYIGLMILYTGAKSTWRILDCGSGVGQVINAWRRAGFENITGIEISEVATRHAYNDEYLKNKMTCGSVLNLPYPDDSFDLVSSFALLEHIDESIIKDVLTEFKRVGTNQAHTIAMEKGSDPGHINMKSFQQWLVYIANGIKDDRYLIASLPDPLCDNDPVFVALKGDYIKRPIWDWMENQKKGIA